MQKCPLPSLPAIILFCGFFPSNASIPTQIGNPNLERIKQSLSYLCGEPCAGRLTGSEGERQAGHYIATFFKDQGLTPAQKGGKPTPYHMTWRYPKVGKIPQDSKHPTAIKWWKSKQVSQPGVACNIAGIIPGCDPKLKNEYIIVTAHYDHLGVRDKRVYAGADDNASGTVGMLEMAACLKESKPKRSIIFLATSGEEKGVLGSIYFVEHCPVPLSSVKGNVNLDMIARNEDDIIHITPAKTDQAVSTLVRDARDIAKNYNKPLSAGIEFFLEESDHAPFLYKGIPAVLFNTGPHPDYHTTRDTIDKLNLNKMMTVIKIARDLVIKAANDHLPPTMVTKKEWSQWQWKTQDGKWPSHVSIYGGPAEE